MRRLISWFAPLAVAAAAAAALDASQPPDDQRPRPAQADGQGLLRINTDYFDLSASSGGDFYFWGPGEFATANLEVLNGGEEIVLAYGPTTGQKQDFEVPVEPGARELHVFCGAQRKDLCILARPDGSLVRPGDDGLTVQAYRFMTIILARNPAPGAWKIELTGAGMHAVTARVVPGTKAPSLDRFAFVEMRGRPGHEGWFELERPPTRGESLPCLAEMAGAPRDVRFQFVDRAGAPLGTPRLERQNGELMGTCVTPDVPFRVVATGLDESGAPFRRMTSHLIVPAP